ncbi:MAG: AAA family ATPase [bacterium]|nr:AAA family ATPase [bacterium]
MIRRVHLPEVTVLAGPNGAGKTTAFRRLVASELEFLSADYEDGGVFQQGKSVLRRKTELEAERKSFCLEMTLASRGVNRWVDEWRRLGYTTRLIFVSLPDPTMAVARVEERERLGGHGVPGGAARITRRFYTGLRNFYSYRDRFDYWAFYDNRDLDGPRPVAHGEVVDWDVWDELLAVRP